MATNATSLVNGVGAQNESPRNKVRPSSNMTLLTELYAMETMFKDEIAKMRTKIENQSIQTTSTEFGKGDEEKPVEHDGAAGKGSLFGDAKSGATATWSFDKIHATLPSAQWVPLGVRNMPPLGSSPLAQEALALENMTTFSHSFLVSILGGEEWSPGLYYPATSARAHSKQLKTMLKSKSYYIMDADFDPFLPKKPAEHGSKLTVFFREDDTDQANLYGNVPLFVALPGQAVDTGEKQYTYLGTYSQLRWSDKLDFDRVQEVVPDHVKEHWAARLTHPEREEWLERAIMEHFWPLPKYEGRMPTISKADSTTLTGASATESRVSDSDEYSNEIKEFVEELAEWQKDAKMKVGLLKKENILEAFTKEDAAEEPGLRFWWEYLQCVGFDRNFYYLLSTAKKETGDKSKANAGEGAI